MSLNIWPFTGRPHRHDAVASQYFPLWRLRLNPFLRRSAVNGLYQVRRDQARHRGGLPGYLTVTWIGSAVISVLGFAIIFLAPTLAWIGMLAMVLSQGLEWLSSRKKSHTSRFSADSYPMDSPDRLQGAWMAGVTGDEIGEFVVLRDCEGQYFALVFCFLILAPVAFALYRLPPVLWHPLVPVLVLCSLCIAVVTLAVLDFSGPSVSSGSLALSGAREVWGQRAGLLVNLPSPERFTMLAVQLVFIACGAGVLLIAIAAFTPQGAIWKSLALVAQLVVIIALLVYTWHRVRHHRRDWYGRTRALLRGLKELDAEYQRSMREKVS